MVNSGEGRSLAVHDRWLARQSVPVVRLDALTPTAEQVEIVLARLDL